jgi:hypothetical protein
MKLRAIGLTSHGTVLKMMSKGCVEHGSDSHVPDYA